MRLVDTTSSLETARFWARFLTQVRTFFSERNYLELTTSQLGDAGALEGTIDTFRVLGTARTYELQVSPEVEMKHFLARHPVSVFQICKCFRDDPDTGIHWPEFSMLEFYEIGADWNAVRERTRELVEFLAGRAIPTQNVDVIEAVRQHAGIELTAHTERAGLATAALAKGFHVSDSDTWEDIFFKIVVERVEPALVPEKLTFLTGYPSAVSPMSVPHDTLRAQRFELFWQGMELANGCTELSDREMLADKLAKERRLREAAGKEPHQIPRRLLEAIDLGMPACAGVAVGLDRLFTCLAR